MDKLTIFKSRLSKIGIEIELSSNIPWIYLDSICGKKVKEKYASEHGFVIGYFNKEFTFENLIEVFKLIKKYK